MARPAWIGPRLILLSIIISHTVAIVRRVAKRKTAEADIRLDRRGRVVEEEETEYGKNVLIVQQDPQDLLNIHSSTDAE